MPWDVRDRVMASFSRVRIARVPFLLGGPISSQCAPRVFALCNLRGAEGVAAGSSAGLSWHYDATGRMLKRDCGN